jgi:hypothetical protein
MPFGTSRFLDGNAKPIFKKYSKQEAAFGSFIFREFYHQLLMQSRNYTNFNFVYFNFVDFFLSCTTFNLRCIVKKKPPETKSK